MILYSIPIFLTAFLMVCFAISKIIFISNKKQLFDEPLEDRKIHLTKTPNLGGVAIFTVFVFTASLYLPEQSIVNIKYLIAGAIILFAVGLTDDLVGVVPLKKFIAQVIVAFLITVMADIRFESFYGFFSIGEIPYFVSVVCSIVFIVFLILTA